MELCPQLGIAIPVGKDSMSMKTTWQDQGEEKSSDFTHVTDCNSLVDASRTLTPQIQPSQGARLS